MDRLRQRSAPVRRAILKDSLILMPLDRLRAALRRLGVSAETTVVVGASGGVDSTVLLRLLHEEGVPLVVVHVDYGLREDSAEDAAFVAALAEEVGAPAEVRRVSLPEAGNRQEAAREARYAVFGEAASSFEAPFVAVGHTANDQAETVLMNLIRGAGQAGLAGMRERRRLQPGVALVRPLLDVTREEVEGLARERGWAWREDASNEGDAYRRNRLRHRVLPLLKEEGGPGTIRRIARTARQLRDETENEEARLDRVGEARQDGGSIPLAALLVLTEKERRALVATALRRWAPDAPRNKSVIANILDLLVSRVGTRIEAGGTVVWRSREHLVIARREEPWEGRPVGFGTRTETPYGTLEIGVPGPPPRSVPADLLHEEVDARALRGTLELRPWRFGDGFRPLGMRGSVLVSDLLTNQKVPPPRRSHQLVLTCDDEIVWVVGHRLAEAARITPGTEEAVSLVWTPGG